VLVNPAAAVSDWRNPFEGKIKLPCISTDVALTFIGFSNSMGIITTKKKTQWRMLMKIELKLDQLDSEEAVELLELLVKADVPLSELEEHYREAELIEEYILLLFKAGKYDEARTALLNNKWDENELPSRIAEIANYPSADGLLDIFRTIKQVPALVKEIWPYIRATAYRPIADIEFVSEKEARELITLIYLFHKKSKSN
jgi:hypothetical protein